MPGIDLEFVCHWIPTDPTVKPMQQRQKQFAPKRNKVINDEVGFVREVHYPEWTSNVVVVQKKMENVGYA